MEESLNKIAKFFGICVVKIEIEKIMTNCNNQTFIDAHIIPTLLTPKYNVTGMDGWVHLNRARK